MDRTHKSPPLGIYIEGLVEGMARQSNQWYSVLEGDGAKEKYRARKDRPKGWSEFALLNKIREDYRKRWQSQLCVSPRQREEVQRAWGQQEQSGDRRDEDKLWEPQIVSTVAFTVTLRQGMLEKNLPQEDSG